MANYNSYPSIGIDAKIKIIQNVLSSQLGFINVDFYGRVQKAISKDQKLFVPEFFYDFPKRKEVYYDGKVAPGGNVMFIDSDKHTELKGGMFQANVKVVFMLNLDKLFSNKKYPTDSEIHDKCIKLVKRIGSLDGQLELEKGVVNVFRGFNIENIKLNDFFPLHTFSINAKLNYNFNCNH